MGVVCLGEEGCGWKCRGVQDSQFLPKAQVNGISSRKHTGFDIWQLFGRLSDNLQRKFCSVKMGRDLSKHKVTIDTCELVYVHFGYPALSKRFILDQGGHSDIAHS